MGQLVLSAAGAFVGGVVGSAIPGVGTMIGAEIGWTIGGIAGAMIFRQKGPNPADIRIQDSAYGKAIPLVYGMFRVSGNMIWAGQPYIEDPGKGAGGKGPQQKKVHMSFALGLCAGPITSVRRIWANGKLIYDVSNPSNFQAISGSNQMVTNFTVYPGDETQEPDPTMQAALGIDATPAHRGLAYVVFNSLDLSQWGNYLPSFTFEVITSPAALASNNIPTTFTYNSFPHGSQGLYMMPCLTAQGGIAMGFDSYPWGRSYVIVVNVSAYGAVQTGTVQFASGGFSMPTGYSDVAGLYTWGGWLHPDGTYDDFSLSGSLNLGVAGSESNFWRNGNDIYLGSGYPGCTTLYRLQIVQPATLPNGVINPGGTVLATAVSPSGGSWAIMGGTASYVYAFSGTTFYRLDRETLATVATFSMGTNIPYIGYVYDDDHIYGISADREVRLFRPSQGTVTAIGPAPFGPDTFVAVNPNFFVFSHVGYAATISLGYMWVSQGQTFTTLDEVVADLCNRAGMSSSQYDVTQLTDTVIGFGITNHSTTRSNLTPLMAAYFFDACDTDGLIKFVKRGSQPLTTFAYADLGASPSIGDTANTTPINETIAQEIDMPRSLSLTYPELNSDYNTNTQRWSRELTNSNKDTVMQVPIVLAGSDALMRAQVLGWEAWIGRKVFSFSTGLKYLQYEPGDVMTLQGDGESYTVRITRCQYDGQGSLLWQAALEEPDIYPSPSYNVQAGAAAGFASQTIDYSGPTLLAVMDVPPLRSTDTSLGLYLAACGMASDWPGCTVDVARPGGAFGQLMNIVNPATMGVAQSALPDFGGGNQPDELSTVTVLLWSGSLASCTYANFLAGSQAAYLGGELIFFRNATQTAANVYQLSGLLRGRGGTEYAMSTHAAGDTFVLLDPARVAAMALQQTDIGTQLSFETFLLNMFGNSPSAVLNVTPADARVKPLAPALFVAGHGSAASTSDISISWLRRARINGQWLDGTDVPLDESSESYQLQVLNGSSIVRTIIVNGPFTAPAVPAYTYTAAQISADGFSTGNTIGFSVAQNSDQGVLGYAATTSIVR
ncbi:Uncharacterised protein [Burkholderia pseudomallei]|nr:Uncharacterised protein [Burkholderia pseudomallei]